MQDQKWKHPISRRNFCRLAGLGLAVACFSGVAGAKDKNADDTPEQGSTPEEIAALKLPAPNTLKVAILPFHDVSGSISHVRMATVANYLLWQREGFQMLPVLAGFKAIEADKDLEPGLPLRRGEAANLGKVLGADWVVYGEVTELRHYVKSGIFKSGKYLIAGIRISVVDVKSGETIYWHQRSDKTGGTGGSANKHAATLKRRGAVIASMNALKPLFAAFPPHTVTNGDTPGSSEVAAMVEQLWPNDKRND